MTKYKVFFSQKILYDMVVEADSMQDAEEKALEMADNFSPEEQADYLTEIEGFRGESIVKI